MALWIHSWFCFLFVTGICEMFSVFDPQVPFLQCGYQNYSWLPASARSSVKARDHKC